ncbi:MAG: PDZ domain-containing protein, partial [bacterium]
NSAIASETGYYQGYGFAIPIDLARQVMDQLVRTGRVERAALGVRVEDASEVDAEYVGMKDVRGVRIVNFSEGSPAQRAGLEEGDIIVTIDGHPVEYTAQLQQTVGFRHPGETVKVEVARKGGVRKIFQVKLISAHEASERLAQRAERSQDRADSPGEAQGAAEIDRLGVKVSPLNNEIARELGLPATARGLLVQTVDPDGPAQGVLFSVETQTPDVILSVEGTPVRTEAELKAALRDVAKKGIVTLIVYNPAVGGAGGRRVERMRLED